MQNFNQKYLMLFASPYTIENENGTKNEGVSAYFLMDDNLKDRTDEEAAARGQAVHGIKPTKMNLPFSAVPELKAVPGLYEVTLKMVSKRVEVRGEKVEIPSMQAVGIKFINSVELKPGLTEADVNAGNKKT